MSAEHSHFCGVPTHRPTRCTSSLLRISVARPTRFASGIAPCSFTRLSTLLATVSSAPLVRRVLQGYDDDDRRRSVLQHRDIITAIEHGDPELATSAMSGHILAARYSALRGTSAST